MNIDQAKIEADKLRNEAKDLMNRFMLSAMNIPYGDGSIRCGEADRIVDCIISCSMIELALLQQQAMKDMLDEQPPLNPTTEVLA